MMVSQQHGQEVIWFDDEIVTIEPKLCFDIEYWQLQNKMVGSAQGRGTTWFVALESMDAAIRHYRRGGLFGRLVKDHYLFSGWENTRSYQEFHLLQQLRAAGVSVPKPIAARVQKQGLTYTADLISEKIPNAKDLVDVLTQRSLNDAIYIKIGQMIRKMHDTQVNHTDLNIHNILLDASQNIWLIDFDKCSIQSGNKWKQSNLERLKRSFCKEKERFHINWYEKEWSFIENGYFSK